MAGRYGGGVEDFNEESAKLRKLRAGRDDLLRKTEQVDAATESLGEAEGRTAKKTDLSTRAQREATEADTRAARVKAELASSTDADTTAIERNTAARQRAVASQRSGSGWTAEAIKQQQAYIDAVQRGATAEAKAIRARLAAQGLVTKGQAGIPGYNPALQPSSHPQIGTTTWERQFAAALKSPNFRFTPNPTRLAQEMAGIVNPDYDPRLQAVMKAKSTKAAREAAQREYEASASAIRPLAAERLGQLSPAQRAEFTRLAKQNPFGTVASYRDPKEQKRAEAAQNVARSRMLELASNTGKAARSAQKVADLEDQAAAVTKDEVGEKRRRKAAIKAIRTDQIFEGKPPKELDDETVRRRGEAAKRWQEAGKKGADAAARRAAAEAKAAAEAERDAAAAQAERERMAALRAKREAVAAAEVAAREKQAAAAAAPGRGLILHPEAATGVRTWKEAYGGRDSIQQDAWLAEARARGHARAAAEAEAYKRELEAQAAFGGGPGAGIILHPDEQVRRAYAGRQIPKYEHVGSPGEGLSYAETGAAQAATARAARREAREANIAQRTGAEAAAHQKAAAAAAEHAASLAHLTAAERVYINSLDEATQKQLRQQAVDVQSAKARQPYATEQATRALQQEAAAMGTVSQAMFKHGALTSEYILATARGETTLKQLGQQAVVTAGKFGGWTIAATALFGAASAIGRVGHGAIQASSGVDQLRRVIDGVDTDEAKGAFADLSREFNVPVDVAIDAVYRMGQRFHTLPEAVEAARASLYSFKTGEVDVATSSQNLIAIVNGFGLSVNELGSVYDQIDQAQNRFSVNIGDTEAGLAKAAGTYRNAGGDLDYLLGLFIAISRATSRSGQEIGTAISRTPNFLRRQKSQDFLAALGIDADPKNVQKTIQNAMKYVRNNPGADVRGIAESIFGPQYARQLEPVLRDQTVLNRALKETSPEASKGAAQKELAHVLAETREQIASLGNELERLGAALSEAGFFTVGAVFLKTLSSALSLATHLVDVFNQLPYPVRQTLVLMGQIGLAIKLLQRFGATERLAGGPLGFLAAPEKQYAVRAKQGVQSYASETKDLAERAQQESVRAAHRADLQAASTQRRRDTLTAHETRLQSDASEESIKAKQRAERQYIASEAELERLNREAATASVRSEDSRAIAMQAERENAAAQQIHYSQMRRYIEQQGHAIPANKVTPNMEGVIPGGGGALPPIEVHEEFTRKATRELGERSKRMRDALTRQYAGLRSLGRLPDAPFNSGYVMGTVDRAAMKVVNTAGQATSAVGRAWTSLKQIPGKMRGLGTGLGFLDKALIGIMALSLLADQLDKLRYHVEDAEEALGKIKLKDPNASGKLQGVRDQLASHDNIGQQLLDTFSHPFNPLAALTEKQKRLNADAAARLSQENLDTIHDLQAQAAGEGRALPQLTYQQAIARIRKTQENRRQGLISQHQFDVAMALHAREITLLLDPTKEQVTSAAAIHTAAQRTEGGLAAYRKALAALKPEELSAEIGAILTTMRTFGATRTDWAHLRAAYDTQVKRLGTSKGANDPGGIQALAEARNAMYEGAANQAKYELELLGNGGTPQERQAAYARAMQLTRRNILTRARNRLRGSQGQVDAARRRAEASQRDADYATNTGFDPHPASPIPGVVVGRPVEELQKRAARDHDRLVKLRKNRNVFRDELDAAELANAKSQAELKDAMFQDRVNSLNLRLQLAQGRTDDPVTAAREAVKTAEDVVALARRKFKPGDTRILAALVGLLGARKELASTITDTAAQLADARDALTVAQAGDDPVAAAGAAQRVAGRQLGRAKTEVERVTALTAVVNANNQMEQAIAEREASRFDLLSSQTTDPLRKAHIDVRKARAALAGATGATDANTKRADLNNAIQAERDAKLDAAEGDIEFEKEMGQITNAQAIARYRELLKIHTLSKQQRRDIRLKIHQLKSESEQEASGFNLDVGSIRLPTIYDVRKAWDPIRRTREAAHHAARDGMMEVNGRHHRAGVVNDVRANISHLHDKRAEVAATVNVYVRDKNAAGEVFTAIDRALGTTVRAQLRSRGMRG